VVFSPDEHNEFRWISVEEARQFPPFSAQVATMEWIAARFVHEEGFQLLGIET